MRGIALANFLATSFHVLLEGVWEVPPTQQVLRETWRERDSVREVLLGDVVSFSSGSPVWPDWYQIARDELLVCNLDEQIHWFSLFVGCVPGHPPTIRALVDNEDLDTLAARLAELPWPEDSSYQSMRSFWLLRGAT